MNERRFIQLRETVRNRQQSVDRAQGAYDEIKKSLRAAGFKNLKLLSEEIDKMEHSLEEQEVAMEALADEVEGILKDVQ